VSDEATTRSDFADADRCHGLALSQYATLVSRVVAAGLAAESGSGGPGPLRSTRIDKGKGKVHASPEDDIKKWSSEDDEAIGSGEGHGKGDVDMSG